MIDDIVKEQQYKFNLSKEKLKAIIMSEYTFLNNLVESGDLESVRMLGLGLFIVKPYRKIKLDVKNKKDEGREIKDFTNRDYSRVEPKVVPDTGK